MLLAGSTAIADEPIRFPNISISGVYLPGRLETPDGTDFDFAASAWDAESWITDRIGVSGRYLRGTGSFLGTSVTKRELEGRMNVKLGFTQPILKQLYGSVGVKKINFDTFTRLASEELSMGGFGFGVGLAADPRREISPFFHLDYYPRMSAGGVSFKVLTYQGGIRTSVTEWFGFVIGYRGEELHRSPGGTNHDSSPFVGVNLFLR